MLPGGLGCQTRDDIEQPLRGRSSERAPQPECLLRTVREVTREYRRDRRQQTRLPLGIARKRAGGGHTPPTFLDVWSTGDHERAGRCVAAGSEPERASAPA